MVVAPGHDGWVEGEESAVLVQFDCGSDTVDVLGLPGDTGTTDDARLMARGHASGL